MATTFTSGNPPPGAVIGPDGWYMPDAPAGPPRSFGEIFSGMGSLFGGGNTGGNVVPSELGANWQPGGSMDPNRFGVGSLVNANGGGGSAADVMRRMTGPQRDPLVTFNGQSMTGSQYAALNPGGSAAPVGGPNAATAGGVTGTTGGDFWNQGLTTGSDKFANLDYRDVINRAFAAQGQQPFYSDTTTPITAPTGFSAQGIDYGTNTPFLDKNALNPFYQPGGAGYAASQNDPAAMAVLDKVKAAQANPGTAPMFNPNDPSTWGPAGNGVPTAPTGPNESGGGNPGMNSGGGVPAWALGDPTDPNVQATAPANAAATYQMSAGQAPNFSAGGYGDYQRSPYLDAMASDLQRRTQDSLGQAFNGIRSDAIGVGGLGGSRQGVAEGVATGKAMDSLQGNLASLGNADYQGAMGRGLQRYQADQGFNLGQGNLGLGYMNGMNSFDLGKQGIGLGYFNGANSYDLGLKGNETANRGQDMSFYTAQRGQDQNGVALGGNLVTQGINAGWIPLDKASDIYNGVAGNNVTATNSSSAGGGWPGMIGGAAAGYQWFNGLGGNKP